MLTNQIKSEKLKRSVEKILVKYPDRIPIIVEKHKTSNLSDLDRKNFLVSKNATIGQFLYILRQRIKLNQKQALFIFINGTIPPTSMPISQLYHEYKDSSDVLRVTYTDEDTFGTF